MSTPLNPAVTDAPLIEPIRLRWSPRAFSDRPISDVDLRTIMSAAAWAASSFNEQPWRYIVARRADGEAFERALACLTPKNAQWARLAAVLMFSLGSTRFAHNGKANRVWLHDVGAASCQLTLQATAMGIYVHQMAGIDPEAVRATYAVAEGFEPVAALAMGYPAGPELLDGPFRAQEGGVRGRRCLGETFFAGRWGEAAL